MAEAGIRAHGKLEIEVKRDKDPSKNCGRARGLLIRRQRAQERADF